MDDELRYLLVGRVLALVVVALLATVAATALRNVTGAVLEQGHAALAEIAQGRGR